MVGLLVAVPLAILVPVALLPVWVSVTLMLILVATTPCAALCYYYHRQETRWREAMIRRCEKQHAAIVRGDTRLGTYGQYPPAEMR